MSEQRGDLRDDLLAVTAARRELGPDEERYLVESFLDRLDREIETRVDARIETKLASLPKRRGGMEAWVVPATLGIAIPISAISAYFAGGFGLLVALVFIISVLAMYAEYSNR